MHHIAIVDFGSQYTHLIANRMRNIGVYTRIYQSDDDLNDQEVVGVVLSGGPNSVYDMEAPALHPSVLFLGVPVLGICYGHQLLAQSLGGIVQSGTTQEYGKAIIHLDTSHPLFDGLDADEVMRASHGDQVTKLPDGFCTIASTHDCPITAMADDERQIYGIQFHPEVTHSVRGMDILRHFVTMTGIGYDRHPQDQIQTLINQIRTQASDRNVFMLVSGGVDSTVAFALINQALGKERCRGLCIDTGLMRQGETQMVAEAMRGMGYDNFFVHDASDRFVDALDGVTDPETKRTIIGQTFVVVQQEVLRDLDLNPEQWMLGQGTIYPDVIESGATKHASTIKTHHNRVAIIQTLIEQGMVIEPLVDLYKDEVRELGLSLGIPPVLIHRHPFPGPGLGIRILCDDAGRQSVTLMHDGDYEHGIAPFRSVGAQGDARSYKHPLILDPCVPYNDAILDYAKNLINNNAQINRVCYPLVMRGALRGLCTRERAMMTRERIELLQAIDAQVTAWIDEHQLYHDIRQMPVVLAPLGYGEGETIILRPIMSREAMTAQAVLLPYHLLCALSESVMSSYPQIDAVIYDCTHKPPATIEWE